MLSKVFRRQLAPQLEQALSFKQMVFMGRPATRFFAAAPKAEANPPFEEPLSITELNQIGAANLAQTKVFDYNTLCNTPSHGVTDRKSTFTSFEDQINSQYQVQQTGASTRESKRVGLLGYKVGMTHYWNKWGQIVPCTVIQIDRCQVTQVKTKAKDGLDAIQIGCGEERLKTLKKPQAGHFLKYNLPPKGDLAEFPVTPENYLPVGYMLSPRHFEIGQFVDVVSLSKGKGFAGVMKRWNFSGQGASHGNSLSHRHGGSIGNREFPGKVFKGRKMAGRLGHQSATVLNQLVVKIDLDKSLLYVKGNVPGAISTLVRIRDAVKKTDKQYLNLQYPTWIPPASEAERQTLPNQLSWDGPVIDPWENYYHENDVVSGKDQEDE